MLFPKRLRHLSYKCGARDRNVAGTSSLARSWKFWGYESEGAVIVKELGADAVGERRLCYSMPVSSRNPAQGDSQSASSRAEAPSASASFGH